MQAIFNVHCRTQYGETLFLLLNGAEIPMSYTADFQWKTVVADFSEGEVLHYSYLVRKHGRLVAESNLKRTITLSTQHYSVELFDDFLSESNLFQTAPFKSYFPHQTECQSVVNEWLLQVYVPFVDKGQRVSILGSTEVLGAWQPSCALPLTYVGDGWWSVALPAHGVAEYKFVIVDETGENVVLWEDGNNRITDFTDVARPTVLNVVFRHQFRWKAAGVAVPVFSLRTENGWGIGEFTDLHTLVDWAAKVGLRMVQILPVNDTTNHATNDDSYPYRANSVYALHPIYLNMSAVGVLQNRQAQESFERQSRVLNEQKTVAYAEVFALKSAFLEQIYSQDAAELFASVAYKTFFDENRHWLVSYAVFSCLRDDFSTADFTQWQQFSAYSSELVEQFATDFPDRVGYYYFVQYHADRQLKAAHQYANSKGVTLKGDLPIGISAESVDAWRNPELFHLDSQAGAPPDDFARNGQNWGFPTYNWAKMAENGFAWWCRRFANMAEYFDAYRIDHILGFFRIWTIPMASVDGILGYFAPAMPLSVDELRARGLWLDIERLTQPYVTVSALKSVFLDDSERIADTLFELAGEHYSFRDEFATQRQLVQFFEQNPNLFSDNQQRCLLDFYQEVLFIEDKVQTARFHPRISPFHTQSFLQLSESEQNAFRAIHDDYFYVRHNEFWKHEALRKMPTLLKSNDMLVCGEDLGMVPSCVPEVMSQLHILSLEVLRMPKQSDLEFISPAQVPYWSVFTTGTHDTSTLRSWWVEDEAKSLRFFRQILGGEGDVPQTCNPQIVGKVLNEVFASNAMLAILPLQDLLALDESLVTENPDEERINDPSNPNHFWCYRMAVDLNELSKNAPFNDGLRNLLKSSGRI